MFLKRFYDDGLAQASYLIGCAATGEAIVIDANRDIAQYIAAAAAEKLRITHVTETHIHADFVSGSRELARATGGTLFLSAEGGTDWQYGFAAPDGATLLRDGDVISVGNIRLEVLHTPGHTPEHISFLVTDTAGANAPIGIVSGDFVFVGDVGRPDLLEKAANVAGTMEAGARDLFRSLERFRALDDFIQVWPGHGAGSACGKALGAVPTSTVGYEKRFNWGVRTIDPQAFTAEVLAGQPDPPLYFAQMKRINRDGPAILGGKFKQPAQAPLAPLEHAMGAGTVVVDTRRGADFAAGHIPGTLNIPLNKNFSTWAGWLIAYDVDIHLITADAQATARAARELAMIGLDRVVGWSSTEVLTEWTASGRALESVPRVDTAAFAARVGRDEVTVLDIRSASEWADGHLAGALHIPLGRVTERQREIPRDKPIVIHCEAGSRSPIGASVLRRLGFDDVTEYAGGYAAWAKAGQPVVRDPQPVEV